MWLIMKRLLLGHRGHSYASAHSPCCRGKSVQATLLPGIQLIISLDNLRFESIRAHSMCWTHWQLARDVKDPQIVLHWNAMNSPTMAWVKINIVTHGYDTINRTTLVIHVKERS